MFIMKKSSGLVTARLAINGIIQRPESYNGRNRTQPTVPLSYTSASPASYTQPTCSFFNIWLFQLSSNSTTCSANRIKTSVLNPPGSVVHVHQFPPSLPPVFPAHSLCPLPSPPLPSLRLGYRSYLFYCLPLLTLFHFNAFTAILLAGQRTWRWSEII